MPLPTKCVSRRFPSRLNRTARSRRAGPRARRPPDQLAWQTLSRSAREGGEQLLWLSLLIAAPVAAQTTSPSKSPAPAAATAPKAMAPAPGAAGSQEQGGLIDINSASAEELDKLPGVGPARAKAIISHRPYNGKDDLANRKVIPQNVYDQIKDKFICKVFPNVPL